VADGYLVVIRAGGSICIPTEAVGPLLTEEKARSIRDRGNARAAMRGAEETCAVAELTVVEGDGDG
jgi:hypothetical protein